MITIYGIANCDKVRQTRKWFKEQAVEHQFHDFRRDGVETTMLRKWLEQLGSNILLNRRGTTWRQLDESQKKQAESDEGVISLMQAQPAVIKRPIVEKQGHIICGFDPEQFKALL